MPTFKINKTYAFNTLAPSILQDRYSSMRVISLMDLTSALKYADVITLKQQVDTIINVPTTIANEMTFVLFENTISKDKVVLSTEWIEEESIEEVTTLIATLKIKDIDSSELNIIRETLVELGFNNFEVKVENI